MQRINSSNRAVDLFGRGKDGFQGGAPATGLKATFLTPEWSNAVQEEIAGVIEGAGLALDGARRSQLREAIAVMLKSLGDAKSDAGHKHDALFSLSNGFFAVLQSDGNLVVRNARNEVIWHSFNTYQRGEADARFLAKDRFDKKSYGTGGDWAGYDVEHPVEGKNTYFNGWVAGVTKGGMEIVHTGGGKYVLNFTTTPAGAATTDRRVVGLQVANDATSVLGQLRVKPGTLENGGGITANNGDTDTGIEFPWADGGFRFRRDGQVPLEFTPDGTIRLTHNGGKTGRMELQGQGNTVWYDGAGAVKAVIWSDGGIHSDKQIYSKSYVHAENEVLSNTLRAKQTLVLNGRTAQSKEIHVYTNEGADMRVHNATANRQMMQLNSDGNLHTLAYGWLHEFFVRRNEFGNSLEISGYQKIAGGLIIQWGKIEWGDVYTGNTSKAATFPIPFPKELLHVFTSVNENVDTNTAGHTLTTATLRYKTKDGFKVDMGEHAGVLQNINLSYLAIGF